MSGERRSAAQAHVPFWRDVRVLALFSQLLALLAVAAVAWFLLDNLFTAMARRGMTPNLGFLDSTAGFEIAETITPYKATDTYTAAFVAGLANTILVSLVGIVLATLLGLVIGIARLSRNWLVNRLSLGYVELFRNTPLLVQLFVIYFAVFLQLPPVRESIALPGPAFLNQRGVFLPRPELSAGAPGWLLLVAAGVGIALVAWLVAGRREAAGRPVPGLRGAGLAALAGLAVGGWLLSQPAPVRLDFPEQGRFNFSGGLVLSPEFAALTMGLALYTAAFIAEIVRGGIEAVSKGQREAARAVGLREGQTLRLVILPQALRIIIPPLTSQYLNLAKNSSLALLIGYADLFNVSTTISNQTGQPVTVILIVMGFYLLISLVTSVLMNLYNRRVQIQVR